MQAAHHICSPLLTISQQSHERIIIRDADTTSSTLSEIATPHGATTTATGSQLLSRVARLSHAITNCLSLPPGSIVMLIAQASGAMFEAMLATLDAGCTLCPINWRWSASELAQALTSLKPALILYDSITADLTTQAMATAFPLSAAHSTPHPPFFPPYLCLIDHWRPSISSSQPTHVLSSSQTHNTTASPSSTHPTTTATSTSIITTTSLLHTAATPPITPSLQPPPPPRLQLLAPPCGTALLVFTSGTTAGPQAVRLSHSSFHAQSLVKLALVGYAPPDTYLHLAPLFHIGGLSSAFAALMAGAAHVFMPRFEPGSALRAMLRYRVSVFISVPTMLQDLAAAGKAIGLSGPRAAVGVGGLKCVRRILVGAGGTSPQLQDAVSRTFPCAELVSAYGMTEACSSMTFRHLFPPAAAASLAQPPPPAAAQMWAPISALTTSQHSVSGTIGGVANVSGSGRPTDPPTDPRGSESTPLTDGVFVGWPAPGVQIMISPSEHHPSEGAAAPHSGPDSPAPTAACSYSVGEVLTRGPHVMLGYLNDPRATAEALSLCGWLRTGDLGYLGPDGGLWLLGRCKDMIKSGGENVFAPQVEAVLCSHPAVVAAAVVGLPDERLGEQVAALLVLRDGWSFDGPQLPYSTAGDTSGGERNATNATRTFNRTELQTHCRTVGGLAGFRTPRFAAAQHEPLPVNASGKVQKALIRQLLVGLRSKAGGRSRL